MTQDGINCIITELKEGQAIPAIAQRYGLTTDEVEIARDTYEYFKIKDKMLADTLFELQELYKKIAHKFLNE
jgi:hypothetical protein